MQRRNVIRGRRARGQRLRGVDGVFWLLLVLACILGGEQAIDGLPRLATIVVPPGLMATEAREPAAQAAVSVPLDGSRATSLFSPQVLQPLQTHDLPSWFRAAIDTRTSGASAPAAPGGAAIAIVIDDLGNDVVAARRVIALPKEVTLSFLPYPDATPELAREATRAGHEILVHVPMEPEGNEDAGPMSLRVGMSHDDISRRLDWAFARVPGFSGINNHMGSRFTADSAALIPVMRALASRHVFFLDSRTTLKTQGASVAAAYGVPTASRDVFLDDESTSTSAGDELSQTEARAREQGVAIAIGHPRPTTLAALEAWTKSLPARHVVLITVSEAIGRRSSHADLRAEISQ
jgi:polysaccharide deacetylase 2 family uncharacterized protein YibQ